MLAVSGLISFPPCTLLLFFFSFPVAPTPCCAPPAAPPCCLLPRQPSQSWLLAPAHLPMPTPIPAPCNRVGTTAETDSTMQRNGDTSNRRKHPCHQMCLGETVQPSCLLPENPLQCFVMKDGLNPSNVNSPMLRGSPDLQFKSKLNPLMAHHLLDEVSSCLLTLLGTFLPA